MHANCDSRLIENTTVIILVSLAMHSQPRLNSFQTVKTLFCTALPGHLDF